MPVSRVDWACPSCGKKFAIRADVPTPKLCPACRDAAKAARAANPETAGRTVRKQKPAGKHEKPLAEERPASADATSAASPAPSPPSVPPSVVAESPPLPPFLVAQMQDDAAVIPSAPDDIGESDGEMEFTPFIGEREAPVPPAPGMPAVPVVQFDQLPRQVAEAPLPEFSGGSDDAAARLLGRRFPALRIIATIYKVFAALALLGALWAMGAGVALVIRTEASPERTVAILLDLGVFAGCAVGAVCLLAFGELIELLLAIEDHTRAARAGTGKR